jgi:hypothetical protein
VLRDAADVEIDSSHTLTCTISSVAVAGDTGVAAGTAGLRDLVIAVAYCRSPAYVTRTPHFLMLSKGEAECLNGARSVLCAGRAAMRVPTAILCWKLTTAVDEDHTM